MPFTEQLKDDMNSVYKATDGLMAMCDDSMLGWKPTSGANWMTVGQLLKHITEACGMCCKGFVTGDWGMPEDMSEEDMLPPAEKLPAAKDVPSTLKKLAEDKKLALDMVAKAGEKDLTGKNVAAPWDPRPNALGRQLLHMIGHLNTHKAQLFYYLKLQGKPVNTMNLYGGG